MIINAGRNSGAGIREIKQEQQSTDGGGTNIITVTLTDGRCTEFYIQNGKNYTLTEADKAEMVDEVIEALPNDGISNDELGSFIQNTDIDYAFDSSTNANYTVIRIYKERIDGSKQYPFVYAPNGVDSGQFTTYDLSHDEGWLLAINAGVFDMSNCKPDGILIQNGEVLQDIPTATHSQCKPLTIDSNGNLGYAQYNADSSALVDSGIVSAVTGFMPIIVDYTPVPSSEWNSVTHYTENAQRQIIGQFGNGDYAIITCEGRSFDNSDGWTIAEAQAICQKHGLKFAYNLDGGGSTETMLGLKHLNTIYENTTGRKVPTFIVFNGTTTFRKTSEKPIYWMVGKTTLHYPDRQITGLNNDANRITTYQRDGEVPLSTVAWSDQEQQTVVTGDSGLYPVKIPEGATSIAVTVPSGYIHGIQFYELVNGAYVRTADPGWNGNQAEYQLADYSASYMQVNVKNDANTNIDASVDVTQFGIEFGYSSGESTSKLPSGYAKLSYIIVPQGAYINTGIPASSDYDAEGKQRAGCLHVLSAENYYYPTFLEVGSSNRVCRYTRFGTENQIPFEFSYNESYAWKVTGNTVEIDGTVMTTSAVKGDSTPTGNLYLFCYGGDPTNTKYQFNNGEFYYLRLFDKTTGTLMYEYLPCVNPDGVVGLYETVNAKFHGSDTSTAFKAG